MTATQTSVSPTSLDPILDCGVIAVVRLNEHVALRRAAAAMVAGGVSAIEITMTTPGAVDTIADLVDARVPGAVIGAGTVLDEEAARTVIDAGASFVVSPTLDLGVIRYCRERGVVCMPGAFSPTEILSAWNAGAPLVKVFPSGSVGADFYRNILGPLPFLKLVPSGGITLENAGEWIRAGAVAISAAAALVTQARVRDESLPELTRLTRAFVDAVGAARNERKK